MQLFNRKRAIKYRNVTRIGQIRQFLAKSGNSQTSFMMGIKKTQIQMIFNNANTIKIILAQIKHTLKYRKETRIGQKCRVFLQETNRLLS